MTNKTDKCGTQSVAGNGFGDLFDYVNFSSQTFKIAGICISNGDTIDVFNFTDSIPSNWDGFSSVIQSDGSGGINLFLYETNAAKLETLTNPYGGGVQTKLIHISSVTLGNACTALSPSLNSKEFKTIKLSFSIEKSPINDEDLVVLVKNPMLIESESVIYIYTVDGKLIHSVVATDSKMAIPKSVFNSKGIYYISMRNEMETKTIPFLVN